MNKTIIAGVFVAAFALAASADDWFNAAIGSYTDWPTNNAAVFGGAWESDAALGDVAALTGVAPNAALEVATDADQPLKFRATNGKTLGTDVDSVTYALTMSFSDYYADGELPAVPPNAKAAVIVVKVGDAFKFYGLAKKESVNAWTDLGKSVADTALDDVPVEVTIKKDGDASFVNYTIGDTPIALNGNVDIPIVAAGAVSTVSFIGDGKVSSLAATTGSADPLPAIAADDDARVATVLASAATSLKNNITNAVEYADFRAWLDSNSVSHETSKTNASSFFNFATAQNGLIVDVAGLADDKLEIKGVAMDGQALKLTVQINGVVIGSDAKDAYLRKIFGVTGVDTLTSTFRADNVTYGTVGVDLQGNATYSAQPNPTVYLTAPAKFFYRATLNK